MDNNTNISLDLAGLNSTALPNLNRPARIWLYNLSFINPRILRDGAPCPDSICKKELYANKTLQFNVTEFSFYSADETPVGVPAAAIGAGGGIGKPRPCLTAWTCTNWLPEACEKGMQTRVCKKTNESCTISTPKPEEFRICRVIVVEKPKIYIFPVSKGCCLFGLCWFKFIVCWYWWILALIILALGWAAKKRIRRISENIKRGKKTGGA